MKITIIQGAFYPVPPLKGGGVEKRWFRLGQEFVAAGHEVLQISRQHAGLPDEEEIKGVRHLRVSGYDQPRSMLHTKWLDLLYSRRACRFVPLDSDIVITNTFWSPLVLPKGLGEKACADIARMPKGQCRCYHRAGRLRANSHHVASAIRKELPSSQHHRVMCIPNPLSFDPPDHVDLALKQQKILYCGRVHPEKGLDMLIKAVRSIPSDWSLDIVGPWETSSGGGGQAYLHELQALAQGLPVQFLGPVFDADRLAAHYRSASVFVYPSVAERGETFGNAPLEGMAFGCVPVVSALSCFQDFITEKSNGLIFDHRAPNAVELLCAVLRSLTEDGAYRHSLARQALLVNESHHPRKIAALFVENFDVMIAERQSHT